MPPPLFQAIAQSWILPLWPTVGAAAAGLVYLRGWRAARATRPRELPVWRAWCFFGGLLAFWIALASPLDALDEFLLLAHMTQHVLLMSIAPPLLLLGNPTVPLLRGLPRRFVREELAPWMNARAVHWLGRLFTNPVFGWVSMCLAVVVWHMPAAYELALRSNGWHEVEHGCFFFSSLSFWWYVVRPWPSRIRSSGWLIVPYVASAHLVLFGVGAVIAFAEGVIYPTYAHVPRLFGMSVLTDQALAGGEMIYAGLLVLIAALVPLLRRLLSEEKADGEPGTRAEVGPRASVRAAARFDLLRVPVVGAALRSRYGRPALQGVSLVALGAVIFDGLHGAPVSGMNAAGALVWNVLRPVNLLLLLLVGNVFCMACPFTLPRALARRFGLPQMRWPEWLSSKWPAAALMLVFFWAYEQFALWNSPRATALLLMGYVGAAVLINSAFRGASFCKYVCPVGQFNFVASLFAPAELGARSQETCASCSTHDCVRGNATQRGCELKLYMPNKIGNMDCTLCLDCVQACPQDNVAITLGSPVRELGRDPARSSVGRFSARYDLAALILVVVFSSLANAAVMTAPVAQVLDGFEQRHGWAAHWFVSLTATCLLAAVLLLLSVGAAQALRALAAGTTLRTVFCRFSMALLPLGLSIWAGHLAFHLAGSWAGVPMLLRHGAMAMTTGGGMQAASSSSMFTRRLGSGLTLFDLQVWVVNLGLFVTWYAGRKAILEMAAPPRRVWPMTAVWGLSSTAVYVAAVWIFMQPMYMRGMGM